MDVNFLLGVKYLNSDWDTPAEDFSTMVTFGVNTSWAPKEWPVRIAVDVFLNAHVSTPTFNWDNGGGSGGGADTSEVAFGVRKIWKSKSVRPFLGGGLNVTSASREDVVDGIIVSTDGSAVGEWVDGGVFSRLGRHFESASTFAIPGLDPNWEGGRSTRAGSTPV